MKDHLQALTRHHGVLNLYRSRVPSLEKSGHEYKGFCPRHNGETKSFTVYQKDGTWLFQCFGPCKAGGNIIKFFEWLDECTWREAIRKVESALGVVQKTDELEDFSGPADEVPAPYEEPSAAGIDDLAEPHATWGYSLARLTTAEANLDQAAAFLATRGVTMETARRLHFGFEKGYLVIPYFVEGDLAAAKLRAIEATSHENKWKKFRRDDKTFWLFNRDSVTGADILDELYITESELDCAMLESMGYRAISVDTAGHKLTEADVSLLKAFPGNIIFAPDRDEKGIDCALRIAGAFGIENPVSIKPTTKDLGDLFAQDPKAFPETFAELRKNASPMWKASFRSLSELSGGKVKMLIQGILSEGNTFIGACSGVGKTWFMLSMAKALATGSKFLGKFEVLQRQKVLYLIPESGDRPFRNRCEKLGMPGDGSVFLCRTMRDGILRLDDPGLAQAVRDWKPVVFLDTAIRFADFKDENSAAENAGGLAELIFQLIRLGAAGVISAHHSPKTSADLTPKNKYKREPSLENMLRGTGDIGAMCDTVWALRHDDGGRKAPESHLQDSKDLTRIYVCNVKPREFEPADPFVIQGKPYIDERGDFVVLTTEEAIVDNAGQRAAKLIEANPQISLSELTKTLGVGRNRFDKTSIPGFRWKETSRTTGVWEPAPGTKRIM